MKCRIEIIRTIPRVSKDGVPFTEVWVSIVIGSDEFVRKFYIWPKS